MKNFPRLRLSSLIVIALFLSCELPNNPVRVISLSSDRNFVWAGESVAFKCSAEDLDKDQLSFVWEASGGQFTFNGDSAIWIAPDTAGYYHISCKVSDGNGTSDGKYLKIQVVKGGAVIEGIVNNAITGLGVEDISISLNGLTVLSDDDGFYSLYVPDLSSSYNITAVGDTFCPFNGLITIPSDFTSDAFEYNFSIGPIPKPGEVRFVLNWGVNPADMDSHIITPEIDSISYHISYLNRGSTDIAPYVILDIDDTDGYGPETITIKQLNNGIYKYYVHQYSSSGSLPESLGRVQVFNSPSCGGDIFVVPIAGEGRYWYVCDLDGITGDVNPINQIVEIEPGS